MLQDADAMLAELDAPKLKLHGETFIGHHLSFEEQVRLLNTLEKLGDAEKRNDFGAMLNLMRKVLDRIFPPPHARWFQRREPTVADRVLALPPAVGCEIVLGFLKSLRSAPLGSSANATPPSAEGPTAGAAGSGTS